MISGLERQIEKLKEEVACHQGRMTMSQLQDCDDLVSMYTGLPGYDVLVILVGLCERVEVDYYEGWTVRDVAVPEQVLMTLMKLRQNFTNADLAFRFKTSPSTVHNIFLTWLRTLHELLYGTFMKTIPSAQKNRSSLPSCFADFNSTRIVIDCTEVGIEVPAQMFAKNVTYSAYKSRNTFKALVGVASNGVVTFTSRLYSGCSSDKEITATCGLLDHLEAGDTVMADKGFLIRDLLPRDLGLNLPPFLYAKQFTSNEVIATRSIARARIHVERAIQRIKLFEILHTIPASLRQFSSDVFQVCAALTNWQNPLIHEVYLNSEDN